MLSIVAVVRVSVKSLSEGERGRRQMLSPCVGRYRYTQVTCSPPASTPANGQCSSALAFSDYRPNQLRYGNNKLRRRKAGVKFGHHDLAPRGFRCRQPATQSLPWGIRARLAARPSSTPPWVLTIIFNSTQPLNGTQKLQTTRGLQPVSRHALSLELGWWMRQSIPLSRACSPVLHHLLLWIEHNRLHCGLLFQHLRNWTAHVHLNKRSLLIVGL